MAELKPIAADFSCYHDRVVAKLERDLGPILMQALLEPSTIEVMVNADGRIWQESLGMPMKAIGTLAAAKTEAIIKTVAGFHNKEATTFKPMVEGELPIKTASRSLPRFAGSLPPVVSAPVFAIRIGAAAVFSLTDYVTAGIMTNQQAELLRAAVNDHKNILVVGGTGSGKTTLINAIILEMVESNDQERIIMIEDTGEIQCSADNFVQFHTTLDISMSRLLKTTLRMRPDRIIIGEVRGAEALDLLMAWNTGHEGGAATLHANHARAALSRLALLVSMNPEAPKPIEPLISEAIQIIVYITKTPQGRVIKDIIEIIGYDGRDYQIRNCCDP
jgi:type IV secretion system protein TrbB